MHRKDHSWRGQSRPLIAQAIASGRDAGFVGRSLWRYVCRSCPWKARGYHPYRIWRHEAAVQIGLKKIPGRRRRRPDQPGQGRLFE